MLSENLNNIEKGMFQSVDGEYRVKDVEVYNKETGSYEPLDPEKIYAVGGINYILRNSGNGMKMFENTKGIIDYVGEDADILKEYFMSFAGSGEYPEITTANSPLAALKGYQLDYENPYGAGRITILNMEDGK